VDGADPVTWTGEVHALHIDAYGSMYEDTQPSLGVKGNRALGPEDQRVVLFFDEDAGLTKACYPPAGVTVFNTDVDPLDPDYGKCVANDRVVKNLDQIAYLWSAAEWLAGVDNWGDGMYENRSPYISDENQRHIYTWNDLNNDGKVQTATEWLPFVPSGSIGGTNWGDASRTSGAVNPRAPIPYDFNVTTLDHVNDIIRWVRGQEWVWSDIWNPAGANLRSRRVEYDFDLDGSDDWETWRMGDVIHSTPSSVARPSEGYHFLYKDGSYGAFLNAYRDRRHVVYFGGNDGMFHAVNAGFYKEDEKKFCRDLHDTTGACLDDNPTPSYSPELGAELWAYVPYNLLPHLKCMTDPDYQHKYYVDQRARIFDVRIWDDTGDDTHVRGWGTILVGGMRFGGTKVTPSTLDLAAPAGPDYPADTREFTSAYFIMDITDPEEPPVLLGEFTRQAGGTEVELGYTTVIPSVVTMKDGVNTNYDDWYLTLGSGPTAMDGTSDQSAKVAVISLKDLIETPRESFRIPAAPPAGGATRGTFTLMEVDGVTPTANAFVSDMVTVDLELKTLYKSDAVYFGTVEGDYGITGGSWGGKLYRLVTRLEKADTPNKGTQLVTVPSDWGALAGGTNPKPLIDVGQPITAAPNISRDAENNFWVYFGTGRFFDPDDKTDSSSNDQQTYYGIKEPRDCDDVFNDDGVTWATVPNTDANFDNYPAAGTTWNTTPGTQGLQRVDQIQVLAAGNSVESTLTCPDEDPDTVGVQPDPDCQALIDTGVDNFYELDEFISGTGKCYDSDDDGLPARDNYSTGTDGWYKDFHDERERNLGQATLLGGLLTFTTYQPYADVCLSEGLAALYGVYYRTGTGYFIPTFGDTTVVDGIVTDKISLGRGMATTPNLHVGKQEGSKAFVQTSTGTIVEIPQPNLPIGTFKTGRQSWIELKP